jgi:integrase/recombinase XerD
MADYLAEFQTWLQNEDKGEKTIRSYGSELRKFFNWYEQTERKVFNPIESNPILLMDYRSYLMNTLEQKPATVNKAISVLKTFFGWAVEVGYLKANPAVKVKMKRVQQNTAPKWLTEQEQNRLLYALETQKNEFKQARDKAVVETMRLAGLRVEEVSDLKIDHVDFKQGCITVVDGKGGKYRIVPLHNDLKKVLKVWLGYRMGSDKEVHRESQYLFVSERSGQMTTRAISFMVDSYFERCGLLERTANGEKLDGQHSCHSLRHLFCKSLVNAGVPIQNVAKLAGHDSIQTTLRYVEPSQQDLRKAINSI